MVMITKTDPEPLEMQGVSMASPSAPPGGHPVEYWHTLADGRLQCDLCPRSCCLADGQAGLCFVRARQGGHLVLTTYGRSSGFCIDPIEKKPLYHFLPGTPVLSFGTAGCNLTCKFCQNWDISKSRETDRLLDAASPEAIAQSAASRGCRSVAYTYNDPVIFLEYARDTALACRALGIKNVAVTAGYISPGAREAFFRSMDATNVDLKSFNEDFYHRVCGGRLQPVLETLEYLCRETRVWVEITTLLIPGLNDSDAELDALTRWVADRLGLQVPIHFSAFHPDWRLLDRPHTPFATLRRARRIALANGLCHVYTGNVRDPEGSATRCHACQQVLIERDGYELQAWRLNAQGRCRHCGVPCAGLFEAQPGAWGNRRAPIRIQTPG